MRDKVFAYIKKKYKASPEYPWAKYDNNAVFRHSDNKKWFALVMDVRKDKLGLSGNEYIDVINLKIDDMMFRDILIQKEGILPAYHMNKEHWITVLLDGTVEEDKVYDLIDASFAATASKKKKEKIRPPKEWIIPANPKFYDVEEAFQNAEIIDWKQSSSMKVGDTIYIYMGAPISAILYKCKAVEVDIPYNYQDKNLTITTSMKMKLLRRYDPEQFTFERLKEEYGIYAVRGPRGVPNSLSHDLMQEYDISNQDLTERFEFRNIRADEAEQAAAIEQICFPPNEACSEKNMRDRMAKAPELFLVAVDKATGKIAGFLNGLATNENSFRDEFFTDANLHDPKGKNIMLLGLDVLPEYRGQGLARELVYQYSRREREKGRRLLLLTCLHPKVKMYTKMGFHDEGMADSSWGGEEWHEMSCVIGAGNSK